jgi:L-cysteate sulfo-lyase
MHLARHPRVRLAHLPTPLEPLDRLSEHLGGPRIWVKRDDCTGLATGGNKTRKLEFLLGDARAQGADVVLTVGAVQSNHARQTAAACAKVGLDCELLLRRKVPHPDPALYEASGNALIDRLVGAPIHWFPGDADLHAEAAAYAEQLRRQGRRPYVIPSGGSNAVGALGYVDAALELVRQADALDVAIDHLVTASSSAGTQAGLVVGLTGSRAGIPVLGVSTGETEQELVDSVFSLASETAGSLGIDGIERRHVVATDAYVGEGYGIPTDAMIEAVQTTARLEGILLDPVYSGKAMAGLFDLARRGALGAGNVVFLHTGGTAGLFAENRLFS